MAKCFKCGCEDFDVYATVNSLVHTCENCGETISLDVGEFKRCDCGSNFYLSSDSTHTCIVCGKRYEVADEEESR